MASVNILFVIPTLGQGGAQRVLVNLANYLADVSNEFQMVGIVTFSAEGRIPHHQPSAKVMLYPVGAISGSRSSGLGLAGSCIKLRRVFDQVQPDVIVAFQDIAIFPTILSCLGRKTALIISERQDTRFYRMAGIRRWLRWMMYRYADKVVVQTELVKGQMPSIVFDRTAIVPNPIPSLNGLVVSGANREISFEIISVGRLEPQKNFSALIDATAIAFQDRDDWTLTIYGEGALRQTLEAQIDSLSLQSKVKLPGITSSVFTKLAQANLFVLTSLYEGFPNVLAEASSIGLPCIAYSDVSGVQDLIDHGVNGLLLSSSQRTKEQLAEAIKYLMNDPKKRECMGKAGVEMALRYNSDTIYKQWVTVINDSIEK